MDAATLTEPAPRVDPRREAEYLELVREHGRAVARVAAAYERDRAEREDLAQDVWLAVWRAWPAFRGECSPRTFVFRIAHNRGISHATRRRLRTTEFDPAHEPADTAPGPERHAAGAQAHAALLAALHALPLAWREVATLRMEGLANHEIAAVLGITENNCAVRLNRARERLKALLESHHDRA